MCVPRPHWQERLDPKNMGGTNRALFFKDQEVLFRELHDDMSTMMSDMQGTDAQQDSHHGLPAVLRAVLVLALGLVTSGDNRH